MGISTCLRKSRDNYILIYDDVINASAYILAITQIVRVRGSKC